MKHFCMTLTAIALAVAACNNEDEVFENSSQSSIAIFAEAQNFGENPSTRNSYDCQTSNNAITAVNSTFEDGDAFGLYIVDQSGKVVEANLKCTLTNGKWLFERPMEYFSGAANCNYYAYYPYRDNVNGGVTQNAMVTTSLSATEFCSDIISRWTPFADQSSKSNFTGSDLMVAKGTVAMPLYHEVQLTFTFQHTMALVLTQKGRFYEQPDGTYRYEDGCHSYSGNVPYSSNGWQWYIIKPDTDTPLGNDTYNLGSGEYLQDIARLPITGPYSVEYSTSSDGGITWSEYTSTQPSWLTLTDCRANVDDYAEFVVDVAEANTSNPSRNVVMSSNNEVLKVTTPVSNVDLSMVDNAGNARASRTTANCYLVHAPGTYRFPLVYGNAIKNGATNSSAYHTDVVDANVRQTLVNHADNEITDPWLKNNGVSVDAIELLWQDAPQVITAVGLSGDYATFTVSSTDIAECNAVIVAKSGGTIVWSWHIWVTPETLSGLTSINTGSHIYNVAPVNVGWVTPQTVITEHTGYHCKVRISSNGSNYIFTVIQPNKTSIISSNYGYSPYYQWGRPVAEPGTNDSGDTVRPVYGISGNTALGDSDILSYSTTSVTIGQNLQNPTVHYDCAGSNCPWNEKKYNYWDMNQIGRDNVNTATVKTVYDPCPPDFCVPTGNLFYYMGKTGGPNAAYGTWDDTAKTRTWVYNGASLVFPAAGYRYNIYLSSIVVGSYGYCWSSSAGGTYSFCACILGFGEDNWHWGDSGRTYSFSIRAVAEE